MLKLLERGVRYISAVYDMMKWHRGGSMRKSVGCRRNDSALARCRIDSYSR